MNNLICFPAKGDRPCRTRLTRKPTIGVESLFDSRSFAMAQLRYAMRAEPLPHHALLPFPIRQFRQRFCKIAREFSGLSRGELSALLNEHPEIRALQKLPGAYRFLPVTEELLISLEENINAIIEYNPYGGGLLGIGAYGAPTNTFVKVIAEICGCPRSYQRFEDWSLECSRRELARGSL